MPTRYTVTYTCRPIDGQNSPGMAPGSFSQRSLSPKSNSLSRFVEPIRNAAWNGLTALTDLDSTTYLHSSPLADPLARRLMREIVTISRALGIEIDPFEPGVLQPEEANKVAQALNRNGRLADALIERVIAVGPITSSMRIDVQNGRPVEADVRTDLPFVSACCQPVDVVWTSGSRNLH